VERRHLACKSFGNEERKKAKLLFGDIFSARFA